MVAPRWESNAIAADLERLGPYWLLDKIADSRLGTVYRACLRRAGEPDKLLAITRIAPNLRANPAFTQHFDTLIGELANVVHPVLCAIEDASEQDGVSFVAAELVAGRDLAQIHTVLAQRGQAMPPALVAYIASQVAEGLAAAHRVRRGGQPGPLCHGEVALADILIDYDGNVRLTGLGSNALRGLLPALGRRGYRAPELKRDGTCDARSDVYSLGACMYKLLTDAPAQRHDRHSESAPLPRAQSHITRVVPLTLQPIIRRALADDPDARFQTATELGRELQRWSLAQSPPGDARRLSAFLQTHFDAEREGDSVALRARLERVPADPVVSMPVPRSRSERSFATHVRSLSPAREAPSAPPDRERFDELSERTPPRGQLMNELAAAMSGDSSAPALRGGAFLVASPRVANEVSTAPSPAAESDWNGGWEGETPAHAWMWTREESAARRNANAGAAPQPRLNTRPPSAPSVSPRSPIAAPPAVAESAGTMPVPRRKSPLLGVGMASAAVIAVIVAIVSVVVLLRAREARPALGTLQVSTRPSGAEVFVQGKRIGVSPLRRDDIGSGKLTLELRKDGFEPLTRVIELMPARFFQLDVDLSSRSVKVREMIAPAASAQQPASAPVNGAGEQADKRSESRRTARSSSGSEARKKRGENDAERAPNSLEAPPRSAGAELAMKNAGDGLAELDVDHAAPAAAEPKAAAAASTGDDTAASDDTASAPLPRAATTPGAPSSPARGQRPATSAPASAPKGASRPATVIERSVPRFPIRATRDDIHEGSVTLEYIVDRTGAVTHARVMQATPPGVFDLAALRAIEKWRYQPELKDGKPVDTQLRATFKFRE